VMADLIIICRREPASISLKRIEMCSQTNRTWDEPKVLRDAKIVGCPGVLRKGSRSETDVHGFIRSARKVEGRKSGWHGSAEDSVAIFNISHRK
jgi:hypothetical protein